jgi:hypothetical protein
MVISMILQSTILCPHCGYAAIETMPTDACQFFYDCKGCGTRLKPRPGDCCVYCSYGSVPCPPVQESGRACCGRPAADTARNSPPSTRDHKFLKAARSDGGFFWPR